MATRLRAALASLVVACGARAAGTAPATNPVTPAAASAHPADGDGVERERDHEHNLARRRFVRARPPVDQLRGVEACAYPSAVGAACIDALEREPDPDRATYMRRLADARARVGQGPRITAATHAEVAECCNREGPCGAEKRSDHADCPRMDDGYACLAAAELLRAERRDGSALHARACRCSPERAAIPIPGGTLACDGPGRPSDRVATLGAREAAEALACASCDPARGPAACAAEREREPALARVIDRVIVPRCELP